MTSLTIGISSDLALYLDDLIKVCNGYQSSHNISVQ